MLLVDVNVLVYAFREDAPDHPSYRRWLTETVSSGQPFGLADLVLSGFLLAAIAIEFGLEWITTDGGFKRFPGLRWRHPLSSA